MGPKGNIIAGLLVLAIGAVVLVLFSSTAFQDFIVDLVKGN